MNFEALAEVLAGVDYAPLTSQAGGWKLYEFVRETRPAEVLELGFAHGTSSVYIAAALQDCGSGMLTTIDRESALSRIPNIHELLALTGLESYVHPIFAERSYTWELMKMIEQRTKGGLTEPLFDFCFLDGAHAWDDDGFAFFLVDKLIKPGGWLLFDDLHWRFADSPTMRDETETALTEDERSTPQVMKVFSLLVYQHPGYTDHRVRQGWGWARKLPADAEDTGIPALIDSLHEPS
jgi:predicted O-methyltransferase YrrM